MTRSLRPSGGGGRGWGGDLGVVKHSNPMGETEVDRSQRVAKIIDPITRSWRLDNIADLVSEVDGNAIAMLQVGDSQASDRLIWPATKNGSYSVKSGYRWVHKPTLRGRPSHSLSSRIIENKVWNGSHLSPSIPDRLILWSPPPNIVTKINVDASLKVVASDATVVESLAILEGCRLAQQLNLARVVIESDSQYVISCLNNGSMSCVWEIFPILSRTCTMGKTFQSCSWSWVPRSANVAADFVASNFTPEMRDFAWVERPPSSLVRILNKDGLPCPPVV
ncbi:hypothetical protein ACFX1Q_010495 [Malus domestica]